MTRALTSATSRTSAKAFAPPLFTPDRTGVLRRKCDCGQHTGGGECEECKKKKSDKKTSRDPLLQRSTINGAVASDRGRNGVVRNQVPSIVHEVLRSSGQPLDAVSRAYFEPRLGQDFSRVRVHVGAQAAASARAMNAVAYTVGRNVVLQDERFVSPSTVAHATLAHELVHVMQQRNAPETTDGLRLGEPNDPMEREAESRAQAIETPAKQVLPSLEASSLLRRLPIPSQSIPTGTPCPTSIRVGQILRVGHNQATRTNRSAFRTYFFGIAKMELGPGPDHSRHCMQEHLRFVSTDCPRKVTDAIRPCSKHDCLQVNSKSGGRYPGGSINDDETSFLDEHSTHNAQSLLEGTGVQSCQTICDQTYSCDSALNPIIGPTFRITRTFQAGTDTLPNGSQVHVTTGNVDKTELSPPAPPAQKMPPGQPTPLQRTLPPGEEYA